MDHSTNTLTAAVKSLLDGVGPAVDRTDPLAMQQLSLVVDYLAFLRQRLPYLHSRALVELRAARDLAEVLTPSAPEVDTDAAQALTDAVRAAQSDVTDLAPLDVIASATAKILAVVREIVRASAGASPQVRRAVDQAVLAHSEQLSPFYRSWYLPMGFDPYPDEVPELSRIIAEW